MLWVYFEGRYTPNIQTKKKGFGAKQNIRKKAETERIPDQCF